MKEKPVHNVISDRGIMDDQNFRLMGEAIPQQVWTARPDGALDHVNDRVLEYFGGSRDEYLEWGWKEMVHPDDLDATIKTWQRSLKTGQPYENQFRLRRAGRGEGAYTWYLARALPFRDRSGEIVKWFGTNTDINDQMLLAEERDQLLASERAARSDAERANRMKDDFLATLSHELRTPLNAIIGWANILNADSTDPASVAEGLEVIERNARVQAQLIDDLLDLSRIISGKLRLEIRPVSLIPLLEMAFTAARPAANGKQIKLTRHFGVNQTMLLGDSGRLQQIVWNLLSNAIKFTPAEGTVDVALTQSETCVTICVTDDGQGISSEILPHIFDRFRQGDSSITRSHAGLGLGLAIVKNLVEMHGGSVSAKSPGVNRGSSFEVVLPCPANRISTDDGERLIPGGIFNISTKATPKIDGLKVLAVDDEFDTRTLLKRLLRDHGADVRCAASAGEGLEILLEFRADVIISDIGMPAVDGYEFLRQVRALPIYKSATIPAIALTAFARTEDRTRALLAGYRTHLSKPVDPAELIAAVAVTAGRI